jgi:uncharacterized protein
MRTALAMISLLLLLFSGCEMDPFLFNPEKTDSYQLPGNTIPAQLLEEVSFTSGKHTLYGIWIASNGRHPGITLLYCHGNKHGIDEYWDRIMWLHELGVNLFVFDYRGYGKSEGTPSNEGLHEDGSAALQFILNQYSADPDSLILYGYSLGNTVSIYLAAEKVDPLLLIAESPFASSTALVQGASGLDLPHYWLTEGTFNNARNIQKIETSFSLFHGKADDFVRWKDNGQVIWDKAPQPKKLTLVGRAGHTDIAQTMGIDHYLAVLEAHIDWAVANSRP